MNFPDNLKYTKDHEWVRIEGNVATVGVTDFAQSELGDIVFVEFPQVGSALQANQPCGLIESVKTGSDLHAPMNGIVTQINTTLQVNPEQINDAPYKTWIFAFESSDEASIQQLLDASAYQALTE